MEKHVTFTYFFGKMSDENISTKTRKRIRRPTIHKKFLDKQKVQKGLEHFSRSRNLIPAKSSKIQLECKCARKCAENIHVQRQLDIFKTFYELNSWTSKTLFLRGCITRNTVKKTLSE